MVLGVVVVVGAVAGLVVGADVGPVVGADVGLVVGGRVVGVVVGATVVVDEVVVVVVVVSSGPSSPLGRPRTSQPARTTRTTSRPMITHAQGGTPPVDGAGTPTGTPPSGGAAD